MHSSSSSSSSSTLGLRVAGAAALRWSGALSPWAALWLLQSALLDPSSPHVSAGLADVSKLCDSPALPLAIAWLADAQAVVSATSSCSPSSSSSTSSSSLSASFSGNLRFDTRADLDDGQSPAHAHISSAGLWRTASLWTALDAFLRRSPLLAGSLGPSHVSVHELASHSRSKKGGPGLIGKKMERKQN